jgi:hypothetical protein
MSHPLSCAAPLVYWGYSTEDRGSHTLFGVMGVIARIPGFSAMPGRPTLLMSGPDPHSQRVGCHEAQMVKRSMHLSCCARSRAWVSSGHFSFLDCINGGV